MSEGGFVVPAEYVNTLERLVFARQDIAFDLRPDPLCPELTIIDIKTISETVVLRGGGK